MTDRVGLARLYIAWPTTAQFTPGDAALDVLAHVLAGDKTSRLYRSLVHDKQIAQDVQAMQQSEEIAGMFLVVLTARPRHSLAELEKAAMEEIDRLKASRRRPRRSPARSTPSRRSSSSPWSRSASFGGRADQLNRYNVMTGDPGYMSKDFDRYLKVDPQAVQRAAKEYLGPGRVVVDVTPGPELSIKPDVLAEAAAAPRGDGEAIPRGGRAVRPGRPPRRRPRTWTAPSCPKPAAEAKFQLPPIHRGRLSNGMELLVVENHVLPLVNLNLVFPRGAGGGPGGASRAWRR